MRREIRDTVVYVFMFLLVISCIPIKKQSNSDLYYSALGFWQSTMDNFKVVYNEAGEQGQKDMLPAMELLLSTKKDILNLWKLALVNNDSGEVLNKNSEWKKAKNQIILKVVKLYTEDKP